MGITPLSTAISTRGKFVEGNTDTGIVKARYPPSRASVRIRKIIGREWRDTQCSDLFCFTQWLRGGYFSLGDSLGASFEPAAGASFGVSAGGASILIFVLSGKPYAPVDNTLSASGTPLRICTSSSCRI